MLVTYDFHISYHLLLMKQQQTTGCVEDISNTSKKYLNQFENSINSASSFCREQNF